MSKQNHPGLAATAVSEKHALPDSDPDADPDAAGENCPLHNDHCPEGLGLPYPARQAGQARMPILHLLSPNRDSRQASVCEPLRVSA